MREQQTNSLMETVPHIPSFSFLTVSKTQTEVIPSLSVPLSVCLSICVSVCVRFWRGLYGRYFLHDRLMEKEEELMTSLRQQNACLKEHILFLTQVTCHVIIM